MTPEEKSEIGESLERLIEKIQQAVREAEADLKRILKENEIRELETWWSKS